MVVTNTYDLSRQNLENEITYEVGVGRTKVRKIWKTV